MYFLFVQDLSSLALKELREGALTTSAGREFQSVTILWLKICPLRLVLCRGLFSFSSWHLVVDSASWKKVSGSILSFWYMILYTCIISPLLLRYSSDGSFRVLSLSMYGCCLKEVIILVALFCTLSTALISVMYLGDQTVFPYSRSGRTRPLYSKAQGDGLLVSRFKCPFDGGEYSICLVCSIYVTWPWNFSCLSIGSVYNHTRVSLPSSHTHVVVSETQGFGYRHTSDDCTE